MIRTMLQVLYNGDILALFVQDLQRISTLTAPGVMIYGRHDMIILDEPTNFLDRDSLGALKKAIDNFEGGVCLITHNKEFADATTRVTWVVANNKCDIKGDAEWEKYAEEQIELQSHLY